MVLANEDSIVAADQSDGEEGLLIFYTPLVLVMRTVFKIPDQSLHHVSPPQLYTRLATKTTMSKRQASTTQRGKALQEGPSPHETT